MGITTLSLSSAQRQEAPPAAPAPERMAQLPIPFVFSGSTAEYFRIWAINTALSVVTLGIYSAWAKVRRTRYFYLHTSVDGSAFVYHASPLAILKGRLIMAVVFVTLALTQALAPVTSQLLFIAIGLVTPALLARAVLFRNANSSYRGIRFGFSGTWRDAWSAYTWPGALSAFTLGLAAPYALFKAREFLVMNATFGSARFGLLADWISFYGIVLRTLLLFAIALIAAGGILVGTYFVLPSDNVDFAAAVISNEILVLLAACAGIAYTHFRTATTNLVWNTTMLAEHRFASSLKAPQMLWLYAGNLVAILMTVGLAIPWARIRLARYRAEHLVLLAGGPLESLVAAEVEHAPATAGEMADALGFDLGV